MACEPTRRIGDGLWNGFVFTANRSIGQSQALAGTLPRGDQAAGPGAFAGFRLSVDALESLWF
jgi:hypothetical protein